MIQHVLVAVDGSHHANRAVEFAADMAAKAGARLTLVHAFHLRELPDELKHLAEIEHLEGDGGKVHRVVGERVLDSAKERAQELGIAEPRLVLAQGDPASTIVETAKKERADVVVVGSRGLGRLAELLLGSVSYKVVMHAPCTVIVVR